VEIGDLDAVEEEAKKLIKINPAYQIFCDCLINLAAEFDEKAIHQLLKNCSVDKLN
jgi:hypothetical protein